MKKFRYKVSLCEYCQQQSCKAFIGLSIRAKMIGGGRPLLPFHPLQNADFQSIFTRSALAVTLSKKVQLSLTGSPLRTFQ